ncbi:Broad specificity phosphatase PhoE [Thermomonospora echinospora]|uniref:Broad specificity phosphatase PhoE n=1 Tax=Thermomonospora echinospora TaxID=1992 RepID=A0A1H6E547_9ACTN|nr:histidine phosphatase family protein [Thermomonospora echinospora]SEG92106.1 Broad specificity phosphatase PhoE [Thermomonospora echinospora]
MINVRRVWLIRHGQSESNAGLPTNGPGASPLTALGRQQAARTAAAFTAPPELIVSSSFVRARQTAEPTVERFPEVPYEEWPVQEFTYLGRLHGAQTTTAQRRPFAEAYWQRADPAYVNGGDGESFTALITRVRAFLDRLADRPEEGTIAVFTHGIFMKAVIWSLFTGVTDPDATAMSGFRHFNGACDIPNCTVTELWRPSGPYGFRVVGGGTTHLADTSTAQGTASSAALD